MNANPTLIRAASALATMVALTAMAPAAQASDWKGYNGVGCLPTSENSDIRRSAAGVPSIANDGTTATTVYCPVVRDVSEGGKDRVAVVAVRFRNRNASSNGTCLFKSYDINGKLVDSNTANAPYGETVLQLGPVNANNWGSYVLQCQIPGKDAKTGLSSYLINYRVDESTN